MVYPISHPCDYDSCLEAIKNYEEHLLKNKKMIDNLTIVNTGREEQRKTLLAEKEEKKNMSEAERLKAQLAVSQQSKQLMIDVLNHKITQAEEKLESNIEYLKAAHRQKVEKLQAELAIAEAALQRTLEYHNTEIQKRTFTVPEVPGLLPPIQLAKLTAENEDIERSLKIWKHILPAFKQDRDAYQQAVIEEQLRQRRREARMDAENELIRERLAKAQGKI
jgi:hypothetical protein